jgi:hypothetical protein
MKYLLCLRGIHYADDSMLKTNFNDTIENIKFQIINPILNAGNTIDIMCFTYDSENIEDLILLYKPIHCVILDKNIRFEGGNWKRQLHWHTLTCDSIKKYEENKHFKFDFIINTRFDALFKKEITSMKLDLTKLNITYKHSSGNCDDNFFFFPRSLLDVFENSVKGLSANNEITHRINHYVGEESINYLSETNADEILDLYRIHRV